MSLISANVQIGFVHRVHDQRQQLVAGTLKIAWMFDATGVGLILVRRPAVQHY
jgi:hypothetical protein